MMSCANKLPSLDPEVAVELMNWTPPPPSTTIQQIRDGGEAYAAAVLAWQREIAPPETEYRVEDHTFPVDGGNNPARCLIPASTSEEPGQKYPLMVWVHGGGYCLGSIEFDDYFLRSICVKYRIVIVSVGYRLAPEHPFPIGINDAYEGLKWAAERCPSLNVATSLGFVVAGCSAGANCTASMVLRARDDPFFAETPITGQLLEIPLVVHPYARLPEKYKPVLKSMSENAYAPLLSRVDVMRFYEALQLDPNDPRFSVLLAPTHAGLPPTYFQVAGADPLRDDGFMYEKALTEAGVKTKLDFYPGYPHGGHYVLPRIKISQKFYQDFGHGLQWLLDQVPSSA